MNEIASVKGDNDVVVAFYQRFAWQYGLDAVLQTIHPDKETVRAYTFKPGDEKGLRALLEKINGVENIYFQVNPLKRPLNGAAKASKEDVAAVHWLQADMDPSPLEDFDKERARILKALETFEPKPNMIIDSGGGYQGFWALTTPLELTPRDDGIEPWAEAESRSQQLALLLSADPCFNCDRIMRVPGTVNVPNKKKRAKGRVAALAKIAHWDDGSYPIERFAKAPVVNIGTGTGKATTSISGGREVKLSGNIARYTPDEIHAMATKRNQVVNDYTMMLIVQGNDPDNPGRYESRSEVLFRVLIDLKKAQFTDEEIAAICMDEDYAISSHVKDQKRPLKYMARQIKRATEAVHSPELLNMNDIFAIIRNYGGKHVIVTEYYDETMKRTILKHQNKDNFMSSWADQKVQIGADDKGPKFMPLGQWWLFHPDARRYDYLVFVPGQEPEITITRSNGFPIRKLNLWQGFACEAMPGDCSIYLEHLKENICSGNEEHYNYLLDWMARGVQEPDKQGEVALVMKGKRGAGKSIAAKVYGSLFGRHFIQTSNASHLVGNFNAHLRDCIVVFADEAFYAGDKKHENVLKTLITEDGIMIEGKGVDAEMSPNYIRLIMASNSDWVVPAGADERRFFVVEVSDKVAKDTAYFGKLMKQIENGGREALLHMLLNRDLTKFNVRKAPDTDALQEQKMFSMSIEEQWWMSKLMEGKIFPETDTWPPHVNKNALYEDYIRECTDVRTYKPKHKIAFGRVLARLIDSDENAMSKQRWVKRQKMNEHGVVDDKLTREYFYDLPTLEFCRQAFDNRFGKRKWPKIAEQSDVF